MGLDPEDTPMLIRDVGTDGILRTYAGTEITVSDNHSPSLLVSHTDDSTPLDCDYSPARTPCQLMHNCRCTHRTIHAEHCRIPAVLNLGRIMGLDGSYLPRWLRLDTFSSNGLYVIVYSLYLLSFC